jgi:hypothetical protein
VEGWTFRRKRSSWGRGIDQLVFLEHATGLPGIWFRSLRCTFSALAFDKTRLFLSDLLSNIIVSSYCDGNDEIDVAINFQVLAEAEGQELAYGYECGTDSTWLFCRNTDVLHFIVLTAVRGNSLLRCVSTLLTTSTSIPRSVHADRRGSLLRDFPHINLEDGFLS